MIKYIHYGNNRYKRRNTACGDKINDSDTVDINKLTCIKCIEGILLRQTHQTRTTGKLLRRRKELLGQLELALSF